MLLPFLAPFLAPLLAALLTLNGCASIDPQVYAHETPALDLRQWFDGTLEGHGMFTDRSGVVKRRFVVTIKASWVADTGTLDEDFVWSDGERQKRVWTLRRQSDGTWQGTAPDVVGTARGVVAGNALNWRYVLALKTPERTWNLDFDDWMFLVDDRVMLNRAKMSFWGLQAGEVLISFRRVG